MFPPSENVELDRFPKNKSKISKDNPRNLRKCNPDVQTVIELRVFIDNYSTLKPFFFGQTGVHCN